MRWDEELFALVLAECEAAVAVVDALGHTTYADARAEALFAELGLGRDERWLTRIEAVRATRTRLDALDELELAGGPRRIGSALVPRGTDVVVVARARPLARTLAETAANERLATLAHIAGGVAHEVSNPMTSIYANLEPIVLRLAHLRLEHPDLASQLAALDEPLDEARDGAERIRHVVEDISRLARGDTLVQPRVDLRESVRSVLRLVASEIERYAVLTYTASPPPLVEGSATRIGLLVMEVMLHALGTLREGSATDNAVVIEVGAVGGDAVFVLRDNGHFTTTGHRLEIARQVAVSLGGSLTSAPRPDGGTVVEVRLPGVAAPPDE